MCNINEIQCQNMVMSCTEYSHAERLKAAKKLLSFTVSAEKVGELIVYGTVEAAVFALSSKNIQDDLGRSAALILSSIISMANPTGLTYVLSLNMPYIVQLMCKYMIADEIEICLSIMRAFAVLLAEKKKLFQFVLDSKGAWSKIKLLQQHSNVKLSKEADNLLLKYHGLDGQEPAIWP